jgi:hypothetical protein
MPEIVAWFRRLEVINPILNTMHSDVHWDELLLAFSHDSDFLQMIEMFSD